MWAFIIRLAITIAVSYLLRPKAQTQPPAGLQEVQAPTAEDGREIPVLFGTRDIRGPNVVWYGNLRTVAIKK